MAEVIFWASVILLGYHAALYPFVVKAMAARQRVLGCSERMVNLPTLTLIVPIFNEDAVLSAKLENLATLEYEPEKLTICLLFDGCTDNSVSIAKSHLLDPRVTIRAFDENRGKTAILNEAIAESKSEIVALNDASAMLDRDALLVSVGYFVNRDIGVVCPTYVLPNTAEGGQKKYWEAQRSLKVAESQVGSVIGPHGAFYLFRRQLWSPLPPDTINDDFVLPMSIVALGYRAVYVPDVVAYELENTRPAQDFRRRLRIAAGNLQQTIRLWRLALPKRGAVAFLFASGKGFRGVMPIISLVGGIALVFAALKSLFYLAVLAACVVGLVLAALTALDGEQRLPRFLITIGYYVRGLCASIIGCFLLLTGWKSYAWQLTRRASTVRVPGVRSRSELR